MLLGLANQSSATTFTWTGATATWTTAANWGGAGFPNAFTDSAQFGAAGNTTPTISTAILVGDTTFNVGAQAYTITNNAGGSLTFGGAGSLGIVNKSAVTQTFTNAAANTSISFQSATAITGAATLNNAGANSFIFFSDDAKAGGATINNSGATTNTIFATRSTAQNATIVNSGAGSYTQFQDTATAGSAHINNVNSTASTIFLGFSDAQNATITNTGANSFTNFQGNSTAGNSTINNTSTTSQVNFFNNSNGGTAKINNNGTVFFGTTAGTDAPNAAGVTVDNAGAGAQTFFVAKSTGGNATIINSGAGSFTDFTESSNAGSATVINTGANSTIYVDTNATGGNAAFVNANATATIDITSVNGPGTTVGSIAGNGSLLLGTKNLTVGSNNTSTTFSGIISDAGGGSLTKVGLGALTLSGANTYTGNTTVNGGALLVNGSIVSPLTLVNHAGLLGGSGVIGGNVVNHGVVEPASTTTGLTVKGNYTQGADGNLRIDVGSNSNFGKLTVNGVANLAGGLTAVVAKGVKPKVGVSFRFLTAAGGVNGRFDELIAPNNGTIVTLGLKYDANSVYLQFLQGKFAALNGLTYNQTAVARNLDRVAFDSREKRLIGYLDSQPLAKLPHDFDLIAPEELSAVWASSFALANIQNTNIQRRTDDIRSGSNGFSAAGLAMNGSSQSYSGPLQFRTGSAGPTGDGKESKEVYNPAPDNKWGVFLSGTGEWINVGDTDNARGYNIDTGGFTLGLDYKITPNFAVGINAGYTGTGVNLTDNGRILVNGGKLGVYATYFTGGFYADASASGGYNSYDIRRHGLGGTVRGDTDGGEFNALVGTGYDFVFGNLKVGPTATFQYSYLGIGDYQEKGSLAPLAVNSQSHDSLRSAFGLRAIYDWKVGGVIVRPEVRAAWQHEYGDRAYAVDSHFASGAGSDFSVDGPEMGRDSLLISAGLAILWNERTSTFLYYDGQVAGTNYDSHSITGGVRVAY